MTADNIKDLLHAAPFVPFVIHLPDRPSVRVQHPDFALLSPTGRTMVIYKEMSDGFSIIDVALVTQVDREALEA